MATRPEDRMQEPQKGSQQSVCVELALAGLQSGRQHEWGRGVRARIRLGELGIRGPHHAGIRLSCGIDRQTIYGNEYPPSHAARPTLA